MCYRLRRFPISHVRQRALRGPSGLTGAESSTFFLPKLVGLRRAMQFALMNPRLDAAAALDWGLVTEVHPAGEFDVAVEKLARQLASGPTEALGIAKRLMNQAAGVDRLDHHLDQELDHLAAIADGPAFKEGITAFFEKRPANFEGMTSSKGAVSSSAPRPTQWGEGGRRPGEGPCSSGCQPTCARRHTCEVTHAVPALRHAL